MYTLLRRCNKYFYIMTLSINIIIYFKIAYIFTINNVHLYLSPSADARGCKLQIAKSFRTAGAKSIWPARIFPKCDARKLHIPKFFGALARAIQGIRTISTCNSSLNGYITVYLMKLRCYLNYCDLLLAKIFGFVFGKYSVTAKPFWRRQEV